eukprot:4993842-Amphidinium_carterae.1
MRATANHGQPHEKGQDEVVCLCTSKTKRSTLKCVLTRFLKPKCCDGKNVPVACNVLLPSVEKVVGTWTCISVLACSTLQVDMRVVPFGA